MLEPVEKEAAKERQATLNNTASGNFPEAGRGQTRDKLAAFTGVSGRTLDKADALVTARFRVSG